MIEKVGEAAVGAAAVRRMLGALGARLELPPEPVLWVEAVPRDFATTGAAENYQDLVGSAEIEIRSQPLLFAVLPGLRDALGDGAVTGRKDVPRKDASREDVP